MSYTLEANESEISTEWSSTLAEEEMDFDVPKGKNVEDGKKTARSVLHKLAKSLKHNVAGLQDWKIECIMFGLYKVARRHFKEKPTDTIVGRVAGRDELFGLLRWLRWAVAAYMSDTTALATYLGIKEECILKHSRTSVYLKPAYYIAVNHSQKCVVFGIRGTCDIRDVLTDLTAHSEEFGNGFCFSGMLEAAQWLWKTEKETLRSALRENKNYGLVVTGHSLGAGTAAVLTLILHKMNELDIDVSKIRCWAYACPPCFDKTLAVESSSYISTVVLQDDIVARISIGALIRLRDEMLETDWLSVLPDGSKRKLLVELVNKSHEFLSGATGIPKFFIYRTARNSVTSVGKLVKHTYRDAQKGKVGNIAKFGTQCIGLVARGAHKLIEEGLEVVANPGEKPTQSEYVERGVETALPTESVNLFPPGTLYHIVRERLEPGQKAPPLSTEQLLLLARARERERERGSAKTKIVGTLERTKSEVEHWMEYEASENKKKERGDCKTKTEEKYRQVVYRGTDPNSRFQRLVLSKTMLSDHNCGEYGISTVKALQWCH